MFKVDFQPLLIPDVAGTFMSMHVDVLETSPSAPAYIRTLCSSPFLDSRRLWYHSHVRDTAFSKQIQGPPFHLTVLYAAYACTT